MKTAYVIMETVTRNGEFVPCIVKEGETGYYTTDWLWGSDIEFARECAKDKNEMLGLSEDDVKRLVHLSMFPNSKHYN